MPAPIVELTATLRTYLPLAPDGLALTTASTSASKFARRSAAGKLALPMPLWMMPAFSTRYSIWPPLAAFTAPATSIVTVPSFGFGIRPFGPSTLPRRPTTPIMSGVAMQRSKSIVPALTSAIASSTPGSLLRSTVMAFCFLGSFAMISALHHFEAHRAGGAFDDAGRRFDIVGVQVLHLLLGDRGQRGALDLARGNLARLLRARLQVRRLLDEEGRRCGLGLEREGTVGIDGDDGGKRRALLDVAGLRVERLAEFHDVDAALTQRRADRRRRIGGAGGHLQLDIAGNLFSHVSHSVVGRGANALPRFKFSGSNSHPRVTSRSYSPPRRGRPNSYFERSTCSNSSSTGVARPKIDTDTLTRLLSKSSSSTMPLKLANGPSSTLTESPIS